MTHKETDNKSLLPKSTIYYLSDCHVELRKKITHPKLKLYWERQLPINNTDKQYLCLIGDIGNPFHPNLLLLLSKLSPCYEKIFYVPGNHEYYNLNIFGEKRSWQQHQDKLIEICAQFANIILLSNTCYLLDECNVKIIGTTLWSHISDINRNCIENVLNDYHLILNEHLNPVSVSDTNLWNLNNIKFLEEEIKDSKSPCIILSHHAPLFSNQQTKEYTADPQYIHSNLNECYHNDLSHLMLQSPIVAWLYGHTHYSTTFLYHGSSIIISSNQLGYENEKSEKTFDPSIHLIFYHTH